MSEVLLPGGWPRPSGYANGLAVPAGRQIFVAGQVGWSPLTLHFESDDLVLQAAQALRNIVAVLAAGEAEPRHIVRLNWYVTDRSAYQSSLAAIGEVYREIIGPHYPAMTLLVVAGLLEPGALVEIEATAVVPA